MKQHLSLLLLLLAMVVAAPAQRRSVAQVRSDMARTLGDFRASRLKTISLAGFDSRMISVMTDREAGFAVVSHAEGLPTVLAYGDQPIDATNPSPEFLYLMECYAAMAERQQRAPIEETPSYTDDLTEVAPLVKTHWAQGTPYNLLTPAYAGYYGYHCVTGCVATAMAQVLYYHRLPNTLRGWKAYGFNKEGGDRVRLSMDFGKQKFRWDDMLLTYDGESTESQRTAVAELMYACGIATNMNYNLSESSAVTWIGADGINSFMDGIRAERHEFSIKCIARELRAGRPVIFEGNNGNGGHCFVIDGSNSIGYLHCNLGWGGGGDGYFLPTDMAGYSGGQAITCVWPTDDQAVAQPLAELQGKLATVSTDNFVTSVEPDRWYILNNSGRAGSPVSHGKGTEVMNTHNLPSHQPTEYCAGQMIRFVPNKAGTAYYIQTGLGDYWGTFTAGSPAATTSTKSATFTLGPIENGVGTAWIKSAAYLDTNGPGSSVVGWGNTEPTDKYSNSAWLIYPVSLEDAPSAVKATSVSLDRENLTMMAGDIDQLRVSVAPATANVQSTLWRSSRATIVTVNPYGQIEALAPGTCNIIATAADGSQKADTCHMKVVKPTPLADPTKVRNNYIYTLRNIGYSQAYLTAEEGGAMARPSLRGVLGLDKDGLCPGKDYATPADWDSPCSYWQILTDEEGAHYLYNLGAKLYLSLAADGASYELVEDPTPISVVADSKTGIWQFRSGTSLRTYLSASTHSESPAACCVASDAGTLWRVCRIENTGLSVSNPLIPASVSSVESRSPQSAASYNLSGLPAAVTDRIAVGPSGKRLQRK